MTSLSAVYLPRIAQDLLRDLDALAEAHATTPGVTAERARKTALASDSLQLLTLLRLRERARAMRIPGVNHALRRVMTAVYGLEIGNDVQIGDGVYFVHPVGTVIGGDARVGSRVRFMGNNTVGTAKDNGYPIIEDDVTVGAGARILGPVRIGRGAVIAANAVVLSDVAEGVTVVGAPAKPVKRSKGNS